ncbi:hypothetical protein ACVXHA_01940 [Escherichia coli]
MAADHRRRNTVQRPCNGGKAFNLPTKLPEGYHTLTLTQDDQRAHCRVIVARETLYEPQALLNKQKLWGACVQLYTLRSEKNWGIGILAISKRCWWMWQNVAGRSSA